MLGQHGYAIIVDPEARGPDEYDVLVCAHTNKVIMVKPRENVYRCTVCNGFIHPSEVGKGCHPMEKKLEAMEARARLVEHMSG